MPVPGKVTYPCKAQKVLLFERKLRRAGKELQCERGCMQSRAEGFSSVQLRTYCMQHCDYRESPRE